jgi:hypothetical protein
MLSDFASLLEDFVAMIWLMVRPWAMHGIGGIVDIQRDGPGRAPVALAPQIHHGPCHPNERAQVGGVLPARQGRLRDQGIAAFRQTAARHLEGWVLAQIVQVVAIRVAAGNRKDAGAQNIRHRMRDQSRIAVIGHESGQDIDQSKLPVDAGQKQHAAVRTDQAAVERGRDPFLADTWQAEGKKCIVVLGGHGRFCPGLESGVSTQFLSDFRRLGHARQRIPDLL